MEDPKFIYILRLLPKYQDPANWTEETSKIIGIHFSYLEELTKKGTMILVGKTQYTVDHPSNIGIAIFRARDEEEARQIMNNDPAIMNGVMTAELHPFSLALLATGIQ